MIARARTYPLSIVLASVVVLTVFACTPLVARAQNLASGSNATCNPATFDFRFPVGTPANPTAGQPLPGGLGLPCGFAPLSTTVTATCIAPLKCQAISVGGAGVDTNLSMLGQLLSQALGSLLQGGKSGSGSGSGSGTSGTGSTYPTGGTTAGCTSYYQVSSPSSDPCAYYVPVGGSSAASDLLSALNGTGATVPTGATASAGPGGSGVGTITNTGAVTTPTVPSDSFSSFTTAVAGAPGPNPNQASGVQGDIALGATGATIYAGVTNTSSNTGVSGFFGANTLGSVRSQGVAAWLCSMQPWKGGFLSSLISDTFFNGLCSWRGYHVGPLPVPPTLVSTPRPTPVPTKSPTPTPIVLAIPPKVQVWAVPDTVSIGSRTSVFWSTQGVDKCSVTSPDGSFNQTALSGGASTVPLTSATTYTISCLDPNGTPVTGYFTVKIAI